ncbi:hypothetical protein [Colwellia sp. Arc7-D]|uniref:hypothetical protein n=1 Tax=Colwellia sp. Arc7-D TaxID=2161872 RepID=UPI000D376205|nr:hypothetical protein [Colwellia sp. Arc7-D]AWB57440.1 hypothetical protein DBO93_07685 [Colwellia sp. Arc7-D]
MTEIYVESAPTAEVAFQKADYLEQRGFTVQTYEGDTITVDSRTMEEGSFSGASNHFLIVGQK